MFSSSLDAVPFSFLHWNKQCYSWDLALVLSSGVYGLDGVPLTWHSLRVVKRLNCVSCKETVCAISDRDNRDSSVTSVSAFGLTLSGSVDTAVWVGMQIKLLNMSQCRAHTHTQTQPYVTQKIWCYAWCILRCSHVLSSLYCKCMQSAVTTSFTQIQLQPHPRGYDYRICLP